MKHILFVDDKAMEAKMLMDQLKKFPVSIYWLPTLRKAKEFLEAKLSPIDLILVDVVGTTIEENFHFDLDSLGQDEKILTTSSIMAPIGHKYKFVLKENLAEAVKKSLGL